MMVLIYACGWQVEEETAEQNTRDGDVNRCIIFVLRYHHLSTTQCKEIKTPSERSIQ